jgi:hypothetical protein
MNFVQQKYWLNALIKNPGITKWYSHWRSSLDGQHSPLADELPWITYGAIDWLGSHLTKQMSIFEWGSGGSTVFFARRVKQVVTIEHDPLWYQEVANNLKRKGFTNVSLNLVEPVPSNHIDIWHTTTDSKYMGYSFEHYIKVIEMYSNEYFDMVVVDGRARPGCMKQAISKIKKGGCMILDNSDRAEYEMGRNLVCDWKSIRFWGPVPYINYPSETQIWYKD